MSAAAFKAMSKSKGGILTAIDSWQVDKEGVAKLALNRREADQMVQQSLEGAAAGGLEKEFYLRVGAAFGKS
jgi:hypothetical protein